ncbi:hypothetical protein ABK040_009230 [Willaertia magna]
MSKTESSTDSSDDSEEEEEVNNDCPFDTEEPNDRKPKINESIVESLRKVRKECDTGYYTVPEERKELIEGTGFSIDLTFRIIKCVKKENDLLSLLSFNYKYGMDKCKFISVKSAYLLSLLQMNYLNLIFNEIFFEKLKKLIEENKINYKPFENFIVMDIIDLMKEYISLVKIKNNSAQELNNLLINSLQKDIIFNNKIIKKLFVDRDFENSTAFKRLLSKSPTSLYTFDLITNTCLNILQNKLKINNIDLNSFKNNVFLHFIIYYLQIFDTTTNYFLHLLSLKSSRLFSWEIFHNLNDDWKEFFYNEYCNHLKWRFEIPNSLQNFTCFEIDTLQNKSTIKINNLPLELLVEIFCNLPLRSVDQLLNLRLICKLWNNLIVTPNLLNNQMIWIQLIYNTLQRSYLYPYCKSFIPSFTINYLIEIIKNQQQNEITIDGFRAWKENIGNVYQKRNELSSSLPNLSFPNFIPYYDYKNFTQCFTKAPDQMVSIFLETRPITTTTTLQNTFTKCNISKIGGYPYFPKNNFNLPNYFKNYKFYLQLNVKETFGKSIIHGGLFPYQKGMLYFFIDESYLNHKRKEFVIGNCVKLLFIEDYNEDDEFIVYKDVLLFNENDCSLKDSGCVSGGDGDNDERIITKVFPANYCFKYDDLYYPGHYYEYGYWKEEIVNYFKNGILPCDYDCSNNSVSEITHVLCCPHLLIPYGMDSGEYDVNFNLILLQNLESTRTTYSVLCDTKELNETIYNLCESYWSRWDSDEDKEIKEKEKRKRLQEGFNFKEMFGLKQKEEKRIGYYVVKEYGRYWATTE